METVLLVLETTRRLASKLAPYAAVELLVPGGTLLALLIYWYRCRLRQKQFSSEDVDSGPLRSTMM